jgi:hypothetical protein
LRRACAEAVEELRAARKLIAAQETELATKDELLALERRITAGLKDLRTMDAAEKAELQNAVDAASRETTALKAANAELKKHQWTFWKKVKTFGIGAAAGFVLGVVLVNN